ncbi:MAG: GlsB/YeaQ/YmgE family stress response membrane protein [Alistipes sp.]|jgi:transglycosylase associated protein|nr:GlsB/YeaQ/YmgE family stress response membrane protein [Alistipes sp.]MBS6458602.1 GlsB/YeaQ/YmgE family stress response membrane protein [Alistipes sp.]
MYFLWYLLIGLAAGWIANLIVKGNGSGLVINLIVGLIGGLLGGWLVSLFGWIPTGTVSTLLTSVAGAIILLLIVSLFTRRKRIN